MKPKISIVTDGRPDLSIEARKHISFLLSNEKHPNWKEKPTYGISHYWLRRNFGSPVTCEYCGKQTRCEWALLKDRIYERDRGNFWGLCRSCHMKYDKGTLFFATAFCKDCGKPLKDKHATRCHSHAQLFRFHGGDQ